MAALQSQKGTRGKAGRPTGGVAVDAERGGYSGLGERHQVEQVHGLERYLRGRIVPSGWLEYGEGIERNRSQRRLEPSRGENKGARTYLGEEMMSLGFGTR